HHRARGNPENTLPHTAISNCFPGLEYDFRNLWRRAFVGIVMLENTNYVFEIEDKKYKHLKCRRLLKVDDRVLLSEVKGPKRPGAPSGPLTSGENPSAAAFNEWGNALAHVIMRQGELVKCEFTRKRADTEGLPPEKKGQTITVKLRIRKFFDGNSMVPSFDLV